MCIFEPCEVGIVCPQLMKAVLSSLHALAHDIQRIVTVLGVTTHIQDNAVPFDGVQWAWGGRPLSGALDRSPVGAQRLQGIYAPSS